MYHRLETAFGNDGLPDEGKPDCSRLIPFGCPYIFMGRKWEITVWAVDRNDANQWAIRHGLQPGDEIIETGYL